MMKYKYFGLAVCLVAILGLASCGGSAGAPGTSGDTGILIKSVSIVPSNIDVDTHIHLCPPSFTTAEAGLFREDATLSIDATKLIPNSLDDPFSASVEECTITYKKANEDPASPIIESMTVYPNCVLLDGTVDCTMPMIDVQRKVKWWDDFSAGTFAPAEYPTHYVAVYRCKYVSAFGDAGFFQTEVDIWLADWDLC